MRYLKEKTVTIFNLSDSSMALYGNKFRYLPTFIYYATVYIVCQRTQHQIIIQAFHIMSIIKIIIKILTNQLTDHLTKPKITSTDQSMNQENKFLNITIL